MALFGNTLAWLKDQFADREEEEYLDDEPTGEEEVPHGQGALPVRSLRPLEAVVMVPRTYGDARRAVDALEKGLVVLVVLNDNVDDETASRFVDFMSGAVYMAHGDIRLLNGDAIVCVPDSVALVEDKLAYVPPMPTWRGTDR